MVLKYSILLVLLLVFMSQSGFCSRVVEHMGSRLIIKFMVNPGFSSVGLFSPNKVISDVGTSAECQIACKKYYNCLSYNYYNQSCELLDDVDSRPKKIAHGEYGTVLNRRGVPFDCVPSNTWTEWSNIWDYCGLNDASKIECQENCVENRSREIVESAAYGGSDCQLNDARYTCVNASDMTHIFLIGGEESSISIMKTILDFIPETKQFIALNQELTTETKECNAILHANRFIVDGGVNSDGKTSAVEFLGGIPLKQQTTGSYTPSSRAGFCSAIWDNHLYQCFGKYSSPRSYKDDCEVYDLNDGGYYKITINETESSGKYAPACISQNQYLYVIGGFYLNGSPYRHDFHKVDLATESKESLADTPFATYSSSAVWFHDNIVVCGGLGDGIIHCECFQYFLINNTWGTFSPMTKSRASFPMVNWGEDKILAIGGYTIENTIDDTIEVYENGAWNQYTQLPYPLTKPASVVINP